MFCTDGEKHYLALSHAGMVFCDEPRPFKKSRQNQLYATEEKEHTMFWESLQVTDPLFTHLALFLSPL